MIATKFQGLGVAFGLALLLLIRFESAPPLAAQTPQASLSITPATLALAPNEQGQALVIARFVGVRATDVRLAFIPEPAVTVEIEPAEPQTDVHGDVTWRAKITRAADGRSTGKITFIASFNATNEGSETTPQVLTTSLDIQERAPAALDTILGATLATTLDNIQDQRTRTVFVVLTNKSTVPVTITEILPQNIPHYTLTAQDVGNGVTLQPQETRPFTVTVAAGDQVEIGKQLLVVQANATWEKDGQRANGALVLTKEFQAGVFGEQEILTATAIPSFFLLPGFLFVITSLLLLKWSWKKEPIPLNLKEPQFWFFGITLSLVAVILYPIVTRELLSWYYQRATAGRDLLQGYGFIDILYLWLGPVFLAIVLWAVLSALVVAARGIREFLRQRHARTHLAAADDSPLMLLDKLANNQSGFALDQVELRRNGKTQTVFSLPRALGAPDGKRWLVPAAVVTIEGENARERKKFLSEKLEQNADARGLENLLRTWGKQIVEVNWDQGDSDALVRQPELVDTTETQELNSRQPFLGLK